MSNLPQRKKTPEEIAKLRESMGLGGPSPAAPPPDTAPAPPPQAEEPPPPVETPVAASPIPVESKAAKPKPSLSPLPSALPSTEKAEAETLPASDPKPVRSLRKSERGPSTASRNPLPHSGATHLPTHRKDGAELNQLRRAQALAPQPSPTYQLPLNAHPFILAAGYSCVIAAAILPFIDHLFTDVSKYVPAVLCIAGLGVAGYIFLKKKLSLPHAGFIAAIAFFTLIFGALYYFPQLRNAP